MLSSRIYVALFWWVVAGLLGLFLRAYPLIDSSVPYAHVLHAHSHIAFLGWVFSALFLLITHYFIKPQDQQKFIRLFVLVQLCNASMLLSFLYQGYGFLSILFSALHMAASSAFAIQVFRSTRGTNNHPAWSLLFLRTSLCFMLLSSLGPLAVPFMIKIYGAGSAMYHNAVHFYLHFQYNGWFLFAIIALILRAAELHQLQPDWKIRWLFISLALSTPLLYFMQVQSWQDAGILRFIVRAASGLQLFGLAATGVLLYPRRNEIRQRGLKLLSAFVFSAFTLKVSVQLIAAFGNGAYNLNDRNLMVGYLHLVLLGIVSACILSFLISISIIDLKRKEVRAGLAAFATGFAVTDALAFLQGINAEGVPYYSFLQLIFSAGMVAGIVMFSFSTLRTGLYRTIPSHFSQLLTITKKQV